MYNLNDDEKQKLDIKMLSHGYRKCDSNFFDTKEYKQLITEMMVGLPKYEDSRLSFKDCNKQQLLASGKYVLDKHAHGGDIRVRYTDMDSMTADLICLFGENPREDQYDEIAKYIDDNIALIKVTDVPVELNLSGRRDGHTFTTFFYGNNLNGNFYKKINPAVKKISVEGACDDDSKCAYVHEMYHALLGSHKGSVENLLHDEVLSIFMEKVAASDLDETGKLEELEILLRLLDNKKDILTREYCSYKNEGDYDRLRIETYILSSAIATKLYDTYKKGNKVIKREIDESISDIMSENSTLEEILDFYEATPEAGSKIMRKQIRHFSK